MQKNQETDVSMSSVSSMPVGKSAHAVWFSVMIIVV